MKQNVNYYGFNWPKPPRKAPVLNNIVRLSLAFLFILAMSFFVLIYTARAQTLPAGFSQVQIATGISNPTVMSLAPDGRIFIAQQNGVLRIFKNGALLPTPFLSLSVNSSGERGLLGIAFDPSFSTNQFVYLYYTVSTGANNRISRFTANGDVVVPGSEVIIKDLDPLSSATNHNGGTMQFGPDGKLYVGIGDNANSSNAMNLDTYHGKVLRINADGSIPAGNPFTGGSIQRQSVWAYGLRNPYTLTFQPGTGRLFVNDVGENSWEEINDATTGGANFGWPSAEGNSSNPAYTNPVFAYGHGFGAGVGCAITGGTFFNPSSTNYPSTYTGNYFFIDYCSNWIDRLAISGSTVTRSNFASSIAGSPVGIMTGADGNLYFLSRDNDALYRISYSGSSAPVITTQPQSQSVSQGNSVTFSVTATGTAPLSYQWKKDNSNITGANSSSYTIPSVVPGDAGNYTVEVSNAAGSTLSNVAVLTVTSVNQPPVATINSPSSNATYAGGDIISYTGTGTDSEDGTLGGTSFTWYVIFHHDTHTHPGPTVNSGVTSGNFTIPNTGETAVNVFYRLYLVVTDSQGATDTAYTDILPRTTQLTIETIPANMQVLLDGQPQTSPYIFTSVEGVIRTISVNSPQVVGGTSYYFDNWSNGGAQSQSIPTPVDDAVYTASFSSATSVSLNPVDDAFVRSGNFSNKNYGNNRNLSSKTAPALNARYLSYLKFDLTSLTNDLDNVTLRLYGHLVNTNFASVTVELFDVPDNSWSESTITYANMPAYTSNVIDDISVSGTAYQYYEFDVTQHIINLKNSGATYVTFMIRNPDVTRNSRVVFNSSESLANKPELVASGIGLHPAVAEPIVERLLFKDEPPVMIMFPNPAHDLVTLKLVEEIQNGNLLITDMQGKIILNSGLNGISEKSLDLSGFDPGTYFVIVHTGEKSKTARLIIAR